MGRGSSPCATQVKSFVGIVSVILVTAVGIAQDRVGVGNELKRSSGIDSMALVRMDSERDLRESEKELRRQDGLGAKRRGEIPFCSAI